MPVPADEDIVKTNGVYYVARVDSEEEPFFRVGVYPDLLRLKMREVNAPTENAAIQYYRSLTRRANKKHPELKAVAQSYHNKVRGTPAAVDTERKAKRTQHHEKKRRARMKRERTEREQAEIMRQARVNLGHSTNDFYCCYATPWAQVWKARRKPKHKALDHELHDFMVMVWKEPVREANGKVRVFESLLEACTYAYDLWEASGYMTKWKDGDPVIWDNYYSRILYRPTITGNAQPFIVSFPYKGTYIKTKAGKPRMRKKPLEISEHDDAAVTRHKQALNFASQIVEKITADQGMAKTYNDLEQGYRTPWGALADVNVYQPKMYPDVIADYQPPNVVTLEEDEEEEEDG